MSNGEHLSYSDWTNAVNGLSYLAAHGGPGECRAGPEPVRANGSAKEETWRRSPARAPRVTIKMSSTESPYRFTTTKNKRNHPQRLELRRYDPVLRRHVLFKEEK